MSNKEQILKTLEGRIDTMTALAIESIELMYKAGYNEAIQDCLANMNSDDHVIAEAIRRLKK